MNALKDLLNSKKVVITDGAWGTELAVCGLGSSTLPETWNLDHPDKIQGIASSYIEAGAEIILTNTFGANLFKLRKAGLADKIEELNREGVALSKDAAKDRALVAASIGPSGEFLEPLGTVTEKEMTNAYAIQAKAMAGAGADAILIETFTDLEESLCALTGVRRSCDLPVIISMTFDHGIKGYATMMGITPATAAEKLQAAGADIVGSNCGSGIDDMIHVIARMAPATDLPLWVRSNAGLPELIDGQTVFKETPALFASRLADLANAGARFIGGCCGTTPEHIRMLVAEREKLTENTPGV